MKSAHTLNDVIRVSAAYAKFEERPTEVSMEDLEFVMGGSLEGLLRVAEEHIPGLGPILDVAREIPGAYQEVKDWYNEEFPSDAQIQQSQETAQSAAAAAAAASAQVTAAAHAADGAAAHQAQLANGVY